MKPSQRLSELLKGKGGYEILQECQLFSVGTDLSRQKYSIKQVFEIVEQTKKEFQQSSKVLDKEFINREEVIKMINNIQLDMPISKDRVSIYMRVLDSYENLKQLLNAQSSKSSGIIHKAHERGVR